MERWAGRVAVVTGASSGIGAAIAAELTKKGIKVVGLDPRFEGVQQLSKSQESATGKLYAVKCDVSNEAEVLTAFKWVKDNLGGVDILINNAGVAYDTSLTGGPTEELKKMLDVNVLGLSVCTKQAFQSMKERGVDDGHIIHINRLDSLKSLSFALNINYFAFVLCKLSGILIGAQLLEMHFPVIRANAGRHLLSLVS
ncbi:hypothetical protein Cfor_12657 [Coptotermes formosanus]|uniref:Uncharacterized protein n=1 Tax=Coptotermes formosanus TaxID=36987 RepID=A0A6L2PD67_COPFO|nr:hypothetical protein Cfor_12657 [Coptotermes formosanus]